MLNAHVGIGNFVPRGERGERDLRNEIGSLELSMLIYVELKAISVQSWQ